MISVKTINNQNAVINSVLGLDGNSNTIINGKLTIQDTSGSLVITPSGIIAPTNTVLNNLTVNGTSNFNNNVNISTYNFDITNSAKNQGMRISNNGATNGITDIEGLGVSTRFNFYSTPSTGPRVNNLFIANGNTCTLQAQAGQGIQMTNNQIAINGISTFNAGSTFKSTPIVAGTDFRVMDTGNNQGIQIFASNDLLNNNTTLQGIGANSRFQINTRDSTNQFRNLFLEYGNHSQLSTATCGIDCLNDTVLLFSNSTTPTISIAPTYPDNTTKIATTSFVSSAITNINPAIRYPPTNSNTLNINNTISLTDGTTTNTLNQSDWTGTIKTVNTTANATHFLNFSDSSSTGQGNPQKSSNLSCNPSTGSITATTFVGSLTGNASSATNASIVNIGNDNTTTARFLTFAAGLGNQSLKIDITTGPLTYIPSTGTLTASIFNGSASTVALTPDDTSGAYYIPFSKTVTDTDNSLFIDNTTTALTYDPSTSTLNCTNLTGTIKTVNTAANATHFLNFSDSSGTGQGHPQKNSNLSCNPFLSKITATTFEGTATASETISLSSDNTSGTYFIPFSKTADTSGNKLFIDNVTGPLSYDPSTSTLNCTNLSGTANIANNVALTSDDSNQTCYIPFSKTTSATSNQLFIDNITSPLLSYNPNSGRLISSIFQGRLIQPIAQSTATFNSGSLSITGGTYTFQNSQISNFTGTTNTISSLNLIGMNVGGVYNVGIYNSASGNLTIGVALGTNIRTKYATPITVPTLGYALMEIKGLSINSITMFCVDVNILNI